MFESKKSQIAITHQKEGIDRPKKLYYQPKKVWLGFTGFRTGFLLLTTPYVMFESKKTQILIAHQKEEIDRTQKSPAIRQKKFG